MLGISIGNSMICSDIWHKYEWYFKIVKRNLREFWNITSSIYAKYHVQIMLLFFYATTRKRVVIFTRRYFKVSWHTTALSQSNYRNVWCSSITNITHKRKQNIYFDIRNECQHVIKVECQTYQQVQNLCHSCERYGSFKHLFLPDLEFLVQ